MNVKSKSVDKLTVEDLKKCPIWEFSNSDRNELAVRPVRTYPVKTLQGRLVGTEALLADGSKVWALLSNIDEKQPSLTKHFITLSIFEGESWFNLARYHDIDAKTRGPKALANFLGRQLKSVFPIYYDIRTLCDGDLKSLKGMIPEVPEEKLTRAQLIALAVQAG